MLREGVQMVLGLTSAVPRAMRRRRRRGKGITVVFVKSDEYFLLFEFFNQGSLYSVGMVIFLSTVAII